MAQGEDLGTTAGVTRAVVVARLRGALAEADRQAKLLQMFDDLVDGKQPTLRRGLRFALSPLVDEMEALVRPIIQSKGPQTTPGLIQLLADQGYDVGGPNPRSRLHARLARVQSLEHIRGVGWSLKASAMSAIPDAGKSEEIC